MEINMADTTFMFLATVMVLLMTPALSLFYGGMVRAKNVLSTTMHSYAAIVVVVIQWILLGYSLSFGGDNSIIGDFSFAFLKNVGFAPSRLCSDNPASVIHDVPIGFCDHHTCNHFRKRCGKNEIPGVPCFRVALVNLGL